MTKRDETVDILRGFGVVLMIIGHVFESQWTRYIFSFHMPLFFFLSGYCYGKKESLDPPMQFLRKKCMSLLVPYVVFFFLHLALYNVAYSAEKGLFLANEMTAAGVLRALVLSGKYLTEIPLNNFPLWFLPHLFVADMIFYGFRRLISGFKTQRHRQLAAAGLALLLMAATVPLQNIFPLRQALLFTAFPVSLSFMLMGWLFEGAVSRSPWQAISRWCCPLLILAGYIVQAANVYDGVPQVYNIRSVLYYVSALCSILGWFGIASRIESPILSYIGRNSIVFLGMHMYVYLHFTAIPRPALITSDTVYNLLRLLAGIVILAVMCEVYNFVKRSAKRLNK